MKAIYLVAALLLVQTYGMAENDRRFYKDLSDKITLKPYFSKYFITFNYVLPNNQIRETYEPNTTYDLGLSLSHKWFSIWYSYSLFNSRDVDKYGKSKSLDIIGDAYFGNHHILTVMFQNYSGFFGQKIPTITPTFYDSLPSVKREDLRLRNYGLQYLYVASGDKLSFRASYSQTQIQQRSKGSFVFGCGMNYFRFWGDSSILNRKPNPTDSLNQEYQYKDGYFLSPSIRAGYVLNLVFLKSFSFLVSAIPGLSYGFSNYYVQGDPVERKRTGLNYQIQFRYGIQFNARYLFFGMDATTDLFSQELNQGRLLYVPTRAELFFGTRFNAPEWLCPKCKRSAY